MKQTLNKQRKLQDFIKNLRAALPYLEKFYDEIFVIKLSGYTILQENLPGILDDIILLRRVGIKIILVHGATPQINSLIRQQDKSAGYADGQLTLKESLFPIAQMAIAATNWELVTKLSNYGTDFLPVTGHFIQARRISDDRQVKSSIGDINNVNLAALHEATAQRYIPIIPPLGLGPRGRLFIVDANRIALEVAARTRARKLIILASENGDKDEEIHLIRQTTTEDMKKWVMNHPGINKTIHNQIVALVEACERGVERCHLLDSTEDGVLLGEVLTSAGMGIMITNSSYQHVRPARMGDVHMIAEILEKPMRDNAIVFKSPQYLEQNIENFIVFCIDEEVVACCELVSYRENQSVEIATLAVKEAHRNRGIGKKLVRAAVDQAEVERKRFIFALTTKAGHLFDGLGFNKLPPDQLPHSKRENYDYEGSSIYGKYL